VQWLSGDIDDGEAVASMAEKLSTLVTAWRAVREAREHAA
jgi:myo-inositol catabolism protein IolC